MLHRAPASDRSSSPLRDWIALLLPVTVAAIYVAALLSFASGRVDVDETDFLAPAVVEPASAAEPPPEVSTADHAVHVHDEPIAEVSSEQFAPRSTIEVAASPAAPRPETGGRIVLWRSETWDAVSAANVQAAISLLPGAVQAQLGNPALGPIKVIVSWDGRTSSGYQPYGRAANFFSTNEGTNEVVLYPQQSVFTVVHELAHAYNLRRMAAGNYAGVLLDPEMQSFMAAAGWQVLSSAQEIARTVDHSQVVMSYSGPVVWESMSRNDPLEDFANSFAMYFLDPSGLSKLSPERFAWFRAHFGS